MKIGIIGGGQLGMMMAESAIKMGHEIYSLDPEKNCPITKFSKVHYTCSFDDKDCIEEMCSEVDVVTYEFENINLEVIEELEKSSRIYPSSKALKYSQNRGVEKKFVDGLGVRVAPYKIITNVRELDGVVLDRKYMLKTLTGGYDGKGQVIINKELTDVAKLLVSNGPCILEEFIEYDYEASIIITRSQEQEIVYFPLVRNEHKDSILFKTTATFKINKEIEKVSRSYAKLISDELDIVGTLAIEFFIKDDLVIFNEMAPRPHNSGHYTIEGCNVSQFDNHINAVTSNKLVEPELVFESVMFNILGEDINKDFSLYDGYLHNYNKNEARLGRKMGHITFVGKTLIEIDDKTSKYLEG